MEVIVQRSEHRRVLIDLVEFAAVATESHDLHATGVLCTSDVKCLFSYDLPRLFVEPFEWLFSPFLRVVSSCSLQNASSLGVRRFVL
ncbi:hypothetical protein DMJ13_26950 [halophilic archaeon]|nr:hypothetical protein DMJ13_26950 [halophilic archaeon]